MGNKYIDAILPASWLQELDLSEIYSIRHEILALSASSTFNHIGGRLPNANHFKKLISRIYKTVIVY